MFNSSALPVKMDIDQASTSSSSVVGNTVEQEDPFVSPEMSQPGPAIVERRQDDAEHRFYSRHRDDVDVAHNDRVHGTNQFGFPPRPHVTYSAQPSGLYIPPQRRFTSATPPTSQPTTWAQRTPNNSFPTFNNAPTQQIPVYQPVAAMDSVVPFDPSSDPPFLDRTKLYVPRANGVIRIKNVSHQLSLSYQLVFIVQITACGALCGRKLVDLLGHCSGSIHIPFEIGCKTTTKDHRLTQMHFVALNAYRECFYSCVAAQEMIANYRSYLDPLRTYHGRSSAVHLQASSFRRSDQGT